MGRLVQENVKSNRKDGPRKVEEKMGMSKLNGLIYSIINNLTTKPYIEHK